MKNKKKYIGIEDVEEIDFGDDYMLVKLKEGGYVYLEKDEVLNMMEDIVFELENKHLKVI